MTTGDIYWAELPRANGHEQAGRRPVVILQDDRHGNNSPLVLAVPLTSATSTLRFAGTVLDLLQKSFVEVDNGRDEMKSQSKAFPSISVSAAQNAKAFEHSQGVFHRNTA